MKLKNRLFLCLAATVGAATLFACASASAQTFNGSITLGDLTQNGRMFRDGVPSDASLPPKAFPGVFDPGTPYHYDAYTFVNPFAVTTAFTITLATNTVSVFPFSETYLGSFDPTNIGTNYLADGGSSADSGAPSIYSFNIPAGASFTVVVNEVTPSAGVADYELTLSPAAVPEPSTAATLVLGVAALGLLAWRRKSLRADRVS